MVKTYGYVIIQHVKKGTSSRRGSIIRTTMMEMTKERYMHWILIIGLLLLIFAAGCRADTAQVPEPTSVDQPTEEIEETETSDDAAEPTLVAEVVESTAEIDECLSCHIDEGLLRDTADPVAEVESESSGEG
jgi:hypothetical protein